ncbi:hypothetical protein Ciccas_004699 [Cichlidogyrus casuarinus]|uniref:Uncharacterized protein n=1 Tax=Cichlidogyrus casuarinus TaxID=1844966 RepID=A0ABD2QAR3_9PLAT
MNPHERLAIKFSLPLKCLQLSSDELDGLSQSLDDFDKVEVENNISLLQEIMLLFLKNPDIEMFDLDFWMKNEYFSCNTASSKFEFAYSIIHHSHVDHDCQCQSVLRQIVQYKSLLSELINLLCFSVYFHSSGLAPHELMLNFIMDTRFEAKEIVFAFNFNFPYEKNNFQRSLLHLHLQAIEAKDWQLSNLTLFLIHALIQLEPALIADIYEFAINHESLFDLAMISLLQSPTEQFLQEMNHLLFHTQTQSAALFVYMKNLQTKHSDLYCSIFKNLFSHAQRILDVGNGKILDECTVDAINLLRVCTALRSNLQIDFPSELSRVLLQLITSETELSQKAVHFVRYAVAFFIANRPTLMDDKASSLASTLTASVLDSDVFTWFNRLIERQEAFYRNCGATYAELLLMLATLYQLNSANLIAETITSILGVSMPSLVRHVNATRKLFTQHLFNELATASQAVKVPITRGLNQNMKGYLPVHCLIPLLQSNAFVKHQVPVGSWIMSQLQACTRPLHESCLKLIDSYVGSILSSMSPQRQTNEAANSLLPSVKLDPQIALPELDLVSFFSRLDAKTGNLKLFDYHHEDLTPHLLLLYYTLSLYDAQLMLRINGLKRRSVSERSFLYSSQIFDKIPITYLLRYCRNHLSDFRPLYPHLLCFITNHFPNLVVGELIIQDELLLDSCWNCSALEQITYTLDKEDIFRRFASILDSKRCDLEQLDQVLKALERLCEEQGLEILLTLTNQIGRTLMQLPILHPQLTKRRRTLNRMARIWRRLHLIVPRDLELVTINALRPCALTENDSAKVSWIQRLQSSVKCAPSLHYMDLVEDPLEHVLFAVDKRIFRIPQLLDLVLRCLESALLASRSMWAHRVVDR